MSSASLIRKMQVKVIVRVYLIPNRILSKKKTSQKITGVDKDEEK
jgi:hypothetical protein